MGLFKRCGHRGRSRDRCDDPWWGTFRGIRVSLGKWTDRDLKNRSDAEAAYDEFKAAVRNRTFDKRGQQVNATTALTFSALADLYIKRQVPNLRSGGTLTNRLELLKAITIPRGVLGEILADALKAADIEDVLTALRNPVKLGPHQKTARVRRPATLNRFRSLLVQLFNWAVVHDYLQSTPFNKAGVRKSLIPALREDNKRNRRLSADEESRLLQAASSQLKLLITAALYSGARRGEMLALTWADLEARPGWIRFRGATTKSGRTRYVPLDPRVQAVCDFLRSDAAGHKKPIDGKVFSNEAGEPIEVWHLTRAWATALRAAKIEDLRWHDLRHEFASRIAEHGVPLVEVRDLLGHASVVTTERYQTNRDERLQAAVKTLAPPAKAMRKTDEETTADAITADLSRSCHSEAAPPDPLTKDDRVF